MSDPKFLAALGARIRELRLKKHLTQNELAMLCNFEKASMSRIESGKTNVTIITLKKISKALDMDLTEFFKE
jgi:transcriptional regulator with XRE-family HTH domain